MPSGGVHPVSGKGTISACVSCPCEPACRERPSVPSCHEHQTWICAPAGWPRRMPSRKSRPRAPIQVPASVVTARGRREDRTMADETFRWFAGVDWGSAKHQVCLLDEAGKVVGERAFAHGGAGLAALCDWLVSAAGDPGSVAGAIEGPHGPGGDALRDRGFAVYAINPKQLDRLRDRISVAGAKDDRRDARVAAAGLRTDRPLFRRVLAGDPSVIELREWSRLAEELQQERVRLSNRIRQQLWRYYPQLLEVSDDVTAEWVLDLWTLVGRLPWDLVSWRGDPRAPRCPMSRSQKDPLRPLAADERQELTRLSRSLSAPAAQVERSRALLAIADGASYTAAAHQVGRRHNETISAWVSRFNRDGLAAVRPGHGGGPRIRYGADAQQRILAEWARTPQREQDGTATWSLSLLQRALRQADDGLPRGRTFTIWRTLHAGGLSWQKGRTWCETGVVMRQRKHGVVRVSDPDAMAKKS